MTLTDDPEILDDKIKANQAQYHLDREGAKISALSSKEMDKYEYLTGGDSGYKTGVVEQPKFEYSPLGRVFNKRLEKEAKKEGLLKRLKNIEDKNKEQLDEIEYRGESQLDKIDKHEKKQLKATEEQKKQLKKSRIKKATNKTN